MNILGIETSCDETAASVVVHGTQILSNVIASQTEMHSAHGGIVPELASRQHILAISPVIREAVDDAKMAWTDIDAVATHLNDPRIKYTDAELAELAELIESKLNQS